MAIEFQRQRRLKVNPEDGARALKSFGEIKI
jgi:hypothetical protein